MAENQEVAPRQRGMTPIRSTLAAGVPQRFEISGDYVHVLTAPVDDLTVRFDSGEPVPMFKGLGFRRYYGELELESATGQAVVVLAGFGSVADARASANVNVTTNIAPGNTIDDGGDVVCVHQAATPLIGADPDRLYVLLANVSSNTITVRVGTSGVGPSTGVPLEPGVTLPYPTTAAVYAWNDDAADDVNIAVSAIKEV